MSTMGGAVSARLPAMARNAPPRSRAPQRLQAVQIGQARRSLEFTRRQANAGHYRWSPGTTARANKQYKRDYQLAKTGSFNPWPE